MDSSFRWLYSGCLCGTAASAAILYLMSQWLAWEPQPPPAAEIARRGRRRLGAALVLATACTFFVGVNFMDARTSPAAYTGVWMLTTGWLVWLMVLATWDIRQTLSELRARRRLLRESVRTWNNPGKDS